MQAIKDDLQIKNSYTNQNERISFSFEVVRCSVPPPGKTCKDDTEMDALLE